MGQGRFSRQRKQYAERQRSGKAEGMTEEQLIELWTVRTKRGLVLSMRKQESFCSGSFCRPRKEMRIIARVPEETACIGRDKGAGSNFRWE